MKRTVFQTLAGLLLGGTCLVACHRAPPPAAAPTPAPSSQGTSLPVPSAGQPRTGRPDFAVEAVATQEGKALWYDVPDTSLAARRAWPEEMTAASDHLPQNTYVRVTRLDPEKGSEPKPVVVRITDKDVGRRDALIEVDKDAAKALGMVKEGTARVRVETLTLKNATTQKPVEAKSGESAVPKASQITDKPAVNVEAEKSASQAKPGRKRTRSDGG